MVDCEKCKNRATCKTPCKEVKAALWKDNRVMERRFGNRIVCYPKTQEVHFTELQDYQLDNFSDADVMPWNSAETRLTKTAVFIERFFNKTPCKELAERFDVKENTIVCMFRDAVAQLHKMIETLDSQRGGLKNMKPKNAFSEDEKIFLLCSVFGFSQVQTAEIMNRDQTTIGLKVKRMNQTFRQAFNSVGGLPGAPNQTI